VLVASGGQFSGITLVCQAAKGKPNGCCVESGPGCLGLMSVCGAALSSWSSVRGVGGIVRSRAGFLPSR
jgi:hypothetical protein